MKQMLHFLNFLFYPGRKIFIALLFFSATMIAQESISSDEFPVGTPIHRLQDYPNILDAFNTMGFNTVFERADDYTKNRLENYNLLAVNARNAAEYINHYTTAYYSKWEAEQNQTDQSRVGVKHKWGQPAYWNDGNDTVLCWSTKNLSSPKDSVMYGPHYRQDNRYKRWLYPNPNYHNVMYNPRDLEWHWIIIIL